jgi:hypothetical protein
LANSELQHENINIENRNIGTDTGSVESQQYPEKITGIEKESYILDEIDAGTTCVTFIQTCTSEEKAKDQVEDQKQLIEMLKKKLEGK